MIIIIILLLLLLIFYRKLHAVYITIDGYHYVWQKAQNATWHYTRRPADWLTLKPDTGMLTHLPLGDSGTRLQRHSLPRTSMFRRISLLVSWAWVGQRRSRTPLLNERRTRTTPTTPRRQVHITSIPVSQHTCNVQESTPASHHGPSHTVQTVVKRRA